jgi:hypothetical protein
VLTREPARPLLTRVITWIGMRILVVSAVLWLTA